MPVDKTDVPLHHDNLYTRKIGNINWTEKMLHKQDLNLGFVFSELGKTLWEISKNCTKICLYL